MTILFTVTLFGVIFMPPSMITVFLFYKYNNFNIESKFQKGMEFCSMTFNLEQCLPLSRLSIFLWLNEWEEWRQSFGTQEGDHEFFVHLL